MEQGQSQLSREAALVLQRPSLWAILRGRGTWRTSLLARDLLPQESEQRVEVLSGLRFFARSIPSQERVQDKSSVCTGIRDPVCKVGYFSFGV